MAHDRVRARIHHVMAFLARDRTGPKPPQMDACPPRESKSQECDGDHGPANRYRRVRGITHHAWPTAPDEVIVLRLQEPTQKKKEAGQSDDSINPFASDAWAVHRAVRPERGNDPGDRPDPPRNIDRGVRPHAMPHIRPHQAAFENWACGVAIARALMRVAQQGRR